ncbi:MAG: type II toxin-antitoxin system RelE/ParE family toxin [bacterium]|nr:type II toxin-antitoxin system RelE/ParE family toxin [bacterium]
MDYKCLIFDVASEVIKEWPQKHRDKVNDFLRLLEERQGILDEPYSRHLAGKIRELRVNFGKTNYRILYALVFNKVILILVAFRKNTSKTPKEEIKKAEELLNIYLNKNQKYEY